MSLSLFFYLRIFFPCPSQRVYLDDFNLPEFSSIRDCLKMKLDAKALRYLTSEDFRVLQGVFINPSTPP